MATQKILTASTTKAVPAAGYATGSAGRTETISHRLLWLFVISVVLSGTALAISGYLSYVAFTSSKILGCGGGVFNCDHVLTSKWSTFLGLPVAAWAGSMYLGVLTALLFSARSAISSQPSMVRQWTWSIVTTGAVSAGLAAMWFIGLQAFVLEHFCPWCLGVHSCGILLSLGTVFYAPLNCRMKGMCASLGFAGTLMLIVVQLMTPAPPSYQIEEFPQAPLDGGVIEEPATFDAPGSDGGGDVFVAPDALSVVPKIDSWMAQVDSTLRSLANPTILIAAQVGDQPAQPAANQPAQPAFRTVHLSGANIKLRPEHWPMVGSPDAKYIFVEMYDYTCKHCRKTQKAVVGARKDLGNELGVILLPVPLNRNCNPHAVGNPNANACELAELAISVWKADQSADKKNFEEFHDWLLTGENPPSLADAKTKATNMVGAAALSAATDSAKKFIKSNVDIYKKMNGGAVPKLIFPTTVMTGELQAANVLVDTIKRQPVQ